MKLIDIAQPQTLLEKLAAKVYTSSSKHLHVINDLIEKEFGIKAYDGSGGMCFLTQFIYTLAAKTGLPAQVIADTFDKKADSLEGHFVDDLLLHFGTVPVEHSGKFYKLKLSYKRHSSIREVIGAIKKGHPHNDYCCGSSAI